MRATKTKKEKTKKKESRRSRSREAATLRGQRGCEASDAKEEITEEEKKVEEEKEVIRNVKVNMNDVEYSVNNKIVEMCRFSDKNIPKDVFETMLFFAEIIIRVGEEPFLQLSKPLGDIITQNEMKKIQTIDKQILINLLSYSTDTNIPALHNFICYTL